MTFMGWNGIQKSKSPEQGVWKSWTYGSTAGWTMRCGAFEADIRRQGESNNFYLTINQHPIINDPNLDRVMRCAEENLVSRIEAVLPAFEIIKSRLAARSQGSVD